VFIPPVPAFSGGLAGGGDSHFQVISGGLMGGGNSVSTFDIFRLYQSASNGTSGTGALTVGVTWPSTTNSGSLLIAVLTITKATAATLTGVFAPSGWVNHGARTNGNTSCRIYAKQAAASQSATGNFGATSTGGSSGVNVIVQEWAAGETSDPAGLDQTGTNSGTSTTPGSGTINPVGSTREELLICGVSQAGTSVSSPTNGFAIGGQHQVGGNVGALIYRKDDTASTPTSTAVTGASAAWATCWVSWANPSPF
jgi:hypothetical protein